MLQQTTVTNAWPDRHGGRVPRGAAGADRFSPV